MKITDLPMTGSFSPTQFDHYDWERSEGFPNTIVLNKDAECENPHYEAIVTFPNGVISLDEIDEWEISVSRVGPNGGACELDDNYIDRFEALFVFFQKTYGEKKNVSA